MSTHPTLVAAGVGLATVVWLLAARAWLTARRAGSARARLDVLAMPHAATASALAESAGAGTRAGVTTFAGDGPRAATGRLLAPGALLPAWLGVGGATRPGPSDAAGADVAGGPLAARRRPDLAGGHPRRPARWQAALARALADAGLPLPAERVPALAGGTAAAAGLLALVSAGPTMAVLAVAAVPALGATVLVALRGRGARQLSAGLPDALEAVARSLRSGASLTGAIGEAAAAAPAALAHDLTRVAAQARHGGGLRWALDRWADRRSLPAVGLAAAALGLAAEAGGAPARALDGVASTLRERLAVERELRALSSQARASGWLIALAPLAFGFFAVRTDERTASFLLATPLGLACLAVGLGLDLVAAVWMARLTRVGP